MGCDERYDELVGDSPKAAAGKNPRVILKLAWWFQACCFCYSAVGVDMAWKLDVLTCHCATYPWRVESILLFLQGFLSFMHDAHFQGRSPMAQWADRSCASFLTLCQPLKFAFCRMDEEQVGILLTFFLLGLAAFKAGGRATALGHGMRYQLFHSLWHILLPLGGFLWIEYTAHLSLPCDAGGVGDVIAGLESGAHMLPPREKWLISG
mmetsp:Transcript_50460/g.83870  ORF Transcript_50460/g.83870 Transcript_50460/m.83870 type:complete len:208 (-) Transcript_50460:91-714(-)